MKKISRYIRHLRVRIRDNKKTFILYSILRALVILTMIRMMFERNFEGFALCVLSLILFLIPSFAEDRFRIEIPPVFEGIIYCFIYAAEILGELNHFYTAIPGWDTVLHTLNGFLCAAVGFSMVYLLNSHSKNVSLSPFYVAMAAFCFSMTIGVIWEFFECGIDMFFATDMQKDYIVYSIHSVLLDPVRDQHTININNIVGTTIHTAGGQDFIVEGGYLDIGLLDTMKDLFVNFIGAIVYSTFGYIYLKQEGKNKTRSARIADSLIVRSADTNDEEKDHGEDRSGDDDHTKRI